MAFIFLKDGELQSVLEDNGTTKTTKSDRTPIILCSRTGAMRQGDYAGFYETPSAPVHNRLTHLNVPDVVPLLDDTYAHACTDDDAAAAAIKLNLRPSKKPPKD